MSERQPSGPGACHDLLPEVADKYFQARPVRERFQYDTAKVMCMAHCAFQLDCLTQAILKPQPAGIRGGESPEAIIALHAEMKREQTPAAVLAARAISHQLPPLRAAYGEPRLRAGHFDTVALAFPAMGGEEREYDDDDRCTACGAHISEPHAPGCPRGELEDDPDHL